MNADLSRTHATGVIVAPSHPYFTGFGFAGRMLGPDDFEGWDPVDQGSLTDIGDATILVGNESLAPSMIEYAWGSGKVIATTLNFCAQGANGPDRPALENLLRYARFFSGTALTPAPTFTPTWTPTDTPVPPTPTRTPTGRATATPTPSPSPTTTLPTLRPGDIDRNGKLEEADLRLLLRLLFEFSGIPVSASGAPREADANFDDFLTAADVVGWLAARAAENERPPFQDNAGPALQIPYRKALRGNAIRPRPYGAKSGSRSFGGPAAST